MVVTLGTDHHPFDRLVSWVDSWLLVGEHRARVDALVQHGTARPPTAVPGRDFLDFAELRAAMSTASIIVTHAGATITECAELGKVPIVVPRLSRNGEVVDDHQVPFARRMSAEGRILLCENESDLHTALDAALADPRLLVVDTLTAGRADPRTAVDKAGQTITALARTRRKSQTRTGPVVAMVTGMGRSGSTLLERMLAELPGACGLGEVTHLWERALGANERCGCGEPFEGCPFWKDVGHRAFGGWEQLDVDEVLAVRGQVDRMRFLGELASGSLRPRTRRALARYSWWNDRLHRAAAAASGASVVIDSSKRASLAFALSRFDDIDLRLVHVVRDPRAVAHSWSRKVHRPESSDPESMMPVYRPWRSAALWDAENFFAELLKRRVPRVLVRYEELVEDPRSVLRTIAEGLSLSISEADLDFIRDGSVDLGPAHLVAGNPMRFTTGRLALSADLEWQTGMASSDRRLVGALTTPLRQRYGYRSRG
ncbi:glycosyltransferase [Angustibacter sp. McL0619]|uniref:glycosyltransferase n=1 Tax=Angustibacter sp. McL0619 TaxID=3415676 RepID=UPI003CEEAC09